MTAVSIAGHSSTEISCKTIVYISTLREIHNLRAISVYPVCGRATLLITVHRLNSTVYEVIRTR